MEKTNLNDPSRFHRPLPSFRLRSNSLNKLRLLRVFDVFDENHDGKISVDELNRALTKLGLDSNMIELAETLKTFMKPGQGGLEFDDFDRLHCSISDAFVDDEGETGEEQEESDLIEAFKVFDEDGDGFISALELQSVLSKLGFPEGKKIETVKHMIVTVDRDNDGQVDYSEFKLMMQGVMVMGS